MESIEKTPIEANRKFSQFAIHYAVQARTAEVCQHQIRSSLHFIEKFYYKLHEKT